MNRERELKNHIKVVTRKFAAELKPLEKEMDKLKNAKELKLMKSYVGRCFKTQNCYGPDDGWWLYQKVLRVKKIEGINRMIVLNVEKDNDNTIMINSSSSYYTHMFDRKEEIKSETFDKHFNKLLKEIGGK